MRFLVDRCAGRKLAEWLRDQKHDVTEARERSPDPGDAALRQWAVNETRILITIDTDFGRLIFVDAQQHCGIIRLADVPVEKRIALISDVLTRHSGDLEAGAIITIRAGRIRISRPPAPADEDNFS
ncbi:MAG: DUF5615 family PIN-like protein [Planctomycetota bacterium]